MSRMGPKPIEIPKDTTIELKGSHSISVKGKIGQTEVKLHPKMNIEKKDDTIVVTRKSDDKISKSLHGVSRKMIINAIKGVNKPFEKKLEVNGVGYKIKLAQDELELSLGYSHPIKFKAPDGIKLEVKKNIITVSGINKQLVGQTAANIRKLRKPEPYKGKGIKYVDEIIIKKAGKAAKAASEEK